MSSTDRKPVRELLRARVHNFEGLTGTIVEFLQDLERVYAGRYDRLILAKSVKDGYVLYGERLESDKEFNERSRKSKEVRLNRQRLLERQLGKIQKELKELASEL